MVIVRQRPGTAKSFVFLTLEDETELVNVIVDPKADAKHRRVICSAQLLVIECVLKFGQMTTDLLARRFRPLDTGGALDGIHARNCH